MAYIGATELTTILPPAIQITGSSIPLTLDEVGTVCAEVSAELNAAAAQAGYEVPVSTAVDAYAQMARYAKIGVGAVVIGIYAPNVPAASGGRTTLAETYAARFEKILERIRKGELVLVGAGSSSGGDARELPRSFETSNPAAARGGASPALSVQGRSW